MAVLRYTWHHTTVSTIFHRCQPWILCILWRNHSKGLEMIALCSVFIATSLDGFIARSDGSIDWLPTPTFDGEDYGYTEFFSSVDTLVLGRNTYELALTFHEWPYTGKKVVVLSSGSPHIPDNLRGKVEIASSTPAELVQRLSEAGSRHIYIDGGKTIQGFLIAEFVDELTVTRIPILIGQGIPLFGPLKQDIKLQLVESKTFMNGLVQYRYRVIKHG
jgi:dihydrofolate reductase